MFWSLLGVVMMSNVENVVIVRYGEIALKGVTTRKRMEMLLKRAIESRLQRCKIAYKDVIVSKARLIVLTKDSEKAAKELTKVFGVVSVSPALMIKSSSIDEIVRAAKHVVLEVIKERSPKSFAVRARRDRRYPITSKDIEKIVGKEIKELTGLAVDLEKPDLELGIEIWIDRAFIYTHTFKGPGGLPFGAEGVVVSLLSGGMDSTLATWLALKRGCVVKPLFIDPGSFWSERARKRMLSVVKKLREWVPEPLEVFIARGFENVMRMILENVESRLRCLVCKCSMLSIAMHLARKINAKAIVTGEVLGQVASQTLDNVFVIDSVARIPVFRPLIFFDKEEIARKLREIGLYDAVAVDVGKCMLVPQHPETKGSIDELSKYLWIAEKAPEIVELSSMIID